MYLTSGSSAQGSVRWVESRCYESVGTERLDSSLDSFCSFSVDGFRSEDLLRREHRERRRENEDGPLAILLSAGQQVIIPSSFWPRGNLSSGSWVEVRGPRPRSPTCDLIVDHVFKEWSKAETNFAVHLKKAVDKEKCDV